MFVWSSCNCFLDLTIRNRSRHGGNPLGLFLHSLLPQFNPDDEPQIDLNGAVGGVNQDQTGLRERAVALMEAMREMMNSIQPDAENGEVPEFLEDEWDWCKCYCMTSKLCAITGKSSYIYFRI